MPSRFFFLAKWEPETRSLVSVAEKGSGALDSCSTDEEENEVEEDDDDGDDDDEKEDEVLPLKEDSA